MTTAGLLASARPGERRRARRHAPIALLGLLALQWVWPSPGSLAPGAASAEAGGIVRAGVAVSPSGAEPESAAATEAEPIRAGSAASPPQPAVEPSATPPPVQPATSSTTPQIDPAAALPPHDSASEYWDVSAQMDSGHRIFARFQITNDGPGEQNGVAVGHVITPDGKTSKFSNGRLQGRWELSEDRLRLDIGKSHLDLHRPSFLLKVRKSYLKLELRFEATASARIPAEVTGSNYTVDLLALAARSRGRLWMEGMTERVALRGRTTLTHTISSKDETDVSLRRIEIVQQEGPLGVYAAEFATPASNRTGWLAARPLESPATDGPIATHTNRVFFTTPVHFSHSLPEKSTEKAKSSSKSKYWVPRTLEIEGGGAAGSVQVGSLLLRHDPLEDLPGPVRWLVGRRMQPRRVWSQGEIEVTLLPSSGPASLPYRGRGVVTTSYLNALTP